MKITVKIGYDGYPYLNLLSNKSCLNDYDAEDEILEYFIREAKKKGIYLKNEASSDMRDDYATVRIRKPSPEDIVFGTNKNEDE